MARRKRLHGLGGSPEHHAEKAKAFFRKAIEDFKGAEKYTKTKACFSAHVYMSNAYLNMGKATAHLEEVPGYVGRERMRHALQDAAFQADEKADGAYYEACGTSRGLSGARRRRSRR